MTDSVSFDVSPADKAIIERILDRYAGIHAKHAPAGEVFDRLHHEMNLVACHVNGCELDLERLAGADDFNLIHDVGGIDQHICRVTGQLMDHFRPRFAAKSPAPA